MPADVVVVDTGNYYPRQRDGRIDAIEEGTDGEPVGVETQLGRPVVKAFNNIYARHLLEARQAGGDARPHRPAGGGRRPRGPRPSCSS